MPNIDDQIRKAMEEGQFDNLPGKGKPLHLDENVHEDPGWRMAYHVLKNAGYTLPWLEKRQEILVALDASRLKLRQVWLWKQAAAEKNLLPAEIEAEWARAVGVFRGQIQDLDKQIRDLNLEITHEHFQLSRLKIEKEIATICVTGEESA